MELSDRFEQALSWAMSLHGGQKRKLTGVPYIGHLLRVCGTVMEYSGDEDEVIAALLHDALEDQNRPGLADEIAERFGSGVLHIIKQCSDREESPPPPWRQRKEAFLERLKTADASVRLVTAADKLDNVRSLTTSYRVWGDRVWEHFRGGKEGTLWYYREVVRVLCHASENALILELESAVRELESPAAGPAA
ncbi:MAG: HD domain-containing protein [Thermogutta sp.]|nr:HD domain-containing protein [Thermogutta sp.]